MLESENPGLVSTPAFWAVEMTSWNESLLPVVGCANELKSEMKPDRDVKSAISVATTIPANVNRKIAFCIRSVQRQPPRNIRLAITITRLPSANCQPFEAAISLAQSM